MKTGKQSRNIKNEFKNILLLKYVNFRICKLYFLKFILHTKKYLPEAAKSSFGIAIIIGVLEKYLDL